MYSFKQQTQGVSHWCYLKRSLQNLNAVQTLSYVSPRAILKAFLPDQKPPQSGGADTGNAKIAAFERYIADKERRGALEEVPEFPARLSWFNSSPLRLDRFALNLGRLWQQINSKA